MDVLDRLADRPDPGGIHPLPKPGGPAERLLGLLIAATGPGAGAPVLESAAMNGLSTRLLADIEAAEKELSEEKGGSLVWEAYRIAVNGLPMDDVRGNLAARLARLERALKEDSLARDP
jgi:hypothetical protein